MHIFSPYIVILFHHSIGTREYPLRGYSLVSPNLVLFNVFLFLSSPWCSFFIIRCVHDDNVGRYVQKNQDIQKEETNQWTEAKLLILSKISSLGSNFYQNCMNFLALSDI